MRAEQDRTIEGRISELIREVVPRRVRPRSEDRLADLGVDSLAMADLAVAIEEQLGVRLADGPLSELRTVGDVVSVASEPPATTPRIPSGIGRIQPWSKRVAGPFFGVYTRLRVEGAEHVPATGPVVLASNHRSFLDIPLLVIASPRPIVFMAKRELYKNRPVGRLLHELGGFPVRREIADLRAVDVGLAVLEEGQVLGMYPEGTRNYQRDLLPFLRGATWLALHTGAPIVPCGIVGTERMPLGPRKVLPRRVRVRFGPAIRLGREPDPLARRDRTGPATEELTSAIASLVR